MYYLTRNGVTFKVREDREGNLYTVPCVPLPETTWRDSECESCRPGVRVVMVYSGWRAINYSTGEMVVFDYRDQAKQYADERW